MLWSPYDEDTYQSVLEHIQTEDIVLDIGAGDLRLSQQVAQIARKLYAIEVNPRLIPVYERRENLTVVVADAQQVAFPADVTVGVLLMRHCRHFRLYADKLKAIGASRFITNARWRMGVEVVDLQKDRKEYCEFDLGWYACWCGQVGFKPGPPSMLTPELDRIINEVKDCPHCQLTGE